MATEKDWVNHKNTSKEEAGDSEPCVDGAGADGGGEDDWLIPFQIPGRPHPVGGGGGAYGWIAINYLLSSFIKLKTDFPTEKENNLREYCTTSYYITTLLVDAYKFENQSWNKIIFKKKARADDPDIGWMLGYTLNLTNLIPTETPVSMWASSVFFIVLVIALSLLALVVQCYTQCRRSFNSHQSATESPERGQERRVEGGRGLVNIEAKYGFVPILVFDAEMTTMVRVLQQKNDFTLF
ncbi:UNVERIFIED_CONTAM: hypothetical protein FKN15_024122 [Acipenser sinensis]